MKAALAEPAAQNFTWGCDTLATLGTLDFSKLAALRVVWRAGYIEKVTAAELSAQLAAGIAFLPVTYALDFDAASQISRLQALGIPKSVTIFLDVEGVSLDAATLITEINTWARAMTAAGYEAGLYVGAGIPLTDVQIYALAVTKYWHSVSKVPDPSVRGCCIRQLRPDDVAPTGVDVDVNVIERDYEGGLPTLAVA